MIVRVNMDSSINNEARFKLLARQVGIPFLHSVGCCWAVWLNCYHSLSERLSISEANASADIDGFAQAMISVGLADAIGDNMMRVHGVKARIEFLKKQRKRGSNGGKNRRKSDVSKQVTTEANAKRTLGGNSASAQAYSPALALAPALTPSPALAQEEQEQKPVSSASNTDPQVRAPNPEDIKAYAMSFGRGEESFADEFWDHYAANGWLNKTGVPVRDWRAEFRKWVRARARNGGKPPETKSAPRNRAESIAETAASSLKAIMEPTCPTPSPSALPG